ncbi:MAG: nucleotide exchange factor GrpE [Bacteroidota bacterium]
MNREEDMNQEQQPPDERQNEEPGQEQSGQNPPDLNLEALLAEAEKQIALYKDQFLRKAAEFDNFKRRAENEAGLIIRYANEDLLQSILPVVDDLERSLKNADNKDGAFYKGIELIYQKILKSLEKQSVRPFETVGKPFDVHYHDALLQVPRNGVPPHTILEEVEKGYLYHDKVLRHAKVVVSSEPADEGEVNEAESGARRDES